MMASIYWSMQENSWPADLSAANALPEGDNIKDWFMRYVRVADCIKLTV